MTIEDIKRTDLTANEKEVLLADKERWQRLGSGAHLNEWLSFYDGLSIRRRLAMKMAHTNQPQGRAYNEIFGSLMRTDGLEVSTAFTAVLWLGDDPERMTILREKILNKMDPGQRSRLNSPISARQRVEKILKARVESGAETAEGEAKVKGSSIAELRRENAKLKAPSARDGNINLTGDTIDSLIDTTLRLVREGKLGEGRVRAYLRGVFKGLDEPKNKPAPIVSTARFQRKGKGAPAASGGKPTG
jgi:hypothetical protein